MAAGTRRAAGTVGRPCLLAGAFLPAGRDGRRAVLRLLRAAHACGCMRLAAAVVARCSQLLLRAVACCMLRRSTLRAVALCVACCVAC